MKSRNLIPAMVLTALLFSCKKEEVAPLKTSFCWECEIGTTKEVTNGTASYTEITKKTYCDKTEAQIKVIEREGTGMRETAEWGFIQRSYVTTKCKKSN